jgi:UDP-N-acetylmuramate dehydrogenase
MKYFILGNGSNILPNDDMFDGVVIYIGKMPTYIDIYDDYIDVSSSYFIPKLVNELSKLNIENLSFMTDIPGTIGGAIYNNSGAYNLYISDYIIDVTFIDKNGDINIYDKDKLFMEYRSSIFKSIDGVILSAKIKIDKNCHTNILEYKNKRKHSQPIGNSFGCIFKNTNNFKAWEVIDLLGLRGFKYNGCMISDKHANFIINYDNCKSSDIKYVLNLIKTKALEELGIVLETEVIIL